MEKEEETKAAAPGTSKQHSRNSRKKSKSRDSPTEEMGKAFAPDKRKPTPAWDALFDSVKRYFVEHVLVGRQEPTDPQAIFDAMNAVLFDGKLPYIEAKYDFKYFEGHRAWGATTSIKKATGEVLRIRANGARRARFKIDSRCGTRDHTGSCTSPLPGTASSTQRWRTERTSDCAPRACVGHYLPWHM